MRNPKHQLSTDLAESLQARLGGLNEKHARKLQKTIVKAALKVAQKFDELQDKERRAARKKTATARPAAPAKLTVHRKKTAAPQAPATVPAGRAPRRKAATPKTSPAATS